MRNIIAITGLSLTFLSAGHAQTLIFERGSVEYEDVTVNGDKIQRSMKRADGGTAVQTIPASSVVRVDWPEPEELMDARELIIRGKYDDALRKAEKVQEQHRPWKDKPGAWYIDASLLAAEAMLRKGDNENAEKLISLTKLLPLNSDARIDVGVLEALGQFLKGISGPAYAKVKELVGGAKDSSTLARIYTLMGDIQYKREIYDEALDAYLHIPVFYGAQAAFLPAAELGAARCLLRLSRAEDARAAFNRIVERYAGTPEADAAKQELSSIDKTLKSDSE